MKTKIITLESHDDLISVRDRLSWAKAPRILLVVPKFENVALRHVDLKVLQRHARSLGAQLGLVTRLRSLRAEAEELGMPVFESTAEAQREAWAEPPQKRMPRRAAPKNLRKRREQVQIQEEAWRSHPTTRVISLAIGVFSVLAIVALFMPRAQIKLTPITQTQNVALPVFASPSTNSVFVTGHIPAREKRIIVDGTQTIAVTGEAAVPESKANGFVEFRNLTQDAVTIPSGTIVSANGVQFQTREEVAVDAGIGKKNKAPIEAVNGGLAGNVDAGAIDAIEGRLGLLVSVSNPEPTLGGRELASVQASDDDRARAKKLLLEFLDGEARNKILNDISPGDVLFEQTISVSRILMEEYDPPAGAAGSTLTLNMQVEYSARYASASDLSELASLALDASVPAGFTPASQAPSLDSVSTPTLGDDGSARWTIRVERKIVQQIDSSQVVRLIQGHRVPTARAQLEEGFPFAAQPEIKLFPSWWFWIPALPFQIEVITE